MVFLTGRVKSALLAVALLASTSSAIVCSSIVTPSYMTRVASLMPLSKVQLAGVIFFGMYSRLKTKGSANFKYYEDSTLHEDFKKYLETLSFADLVEMFDKWAVGRAVSIADVVYFVGEENNREKIKSNKLLVKPFGLLGYFEAYVLQVLKPLSEATENFGKVGKLSSIYFDIDLV